MKFISSRFKCTIHLQVILTSVDKFSFIIYKFRFSLEKPLGRILSYGLLTFFKNSEIMHVDYK